MRESAIYQDILEKGLQEGRQRGRQEGKQEEARLRDGQTDRDDGGAILQQLRGVSY